MQLYYIQYPTVHLNHASPQRPVVVSNNLVKKVFIAARRMRREQSKIQNIYSRGGVPQT
jgi:hypothetical protein